MAYEYLYSYDEKGNLTGSVTQYKGVDGRKLQWKYTYKNKMRENTPPQLSDRLGTYKDTEGNYLIIRSAMLLENPVSYTIDFCFVEKDYNKNFTGGSKILFTYDATGRRTGFKDTYGEAGTRTYNSDGTLKMINIGDGRSIRTFEYEEGAPSMDASYYYQF